MNGLKSLENFGNLALKQSMTKLVVYCRFFFLLNQTSITIPLTVHPLRSDSDVIPEGFLVHVIIELIPIT